MLSVLLLITLMVVLALWVKGTRANRQRWLQQLNLPGVWHSDDSAAALTLEFRGELDQGQYCESGSAVAREGAWHLYGGTLVLTPGNSGSSDQEVCYELTLFDRARIGLHGPEHEHRVFRKAADNVVPLKKAGI